MWIIPLANGTNRYIYWSVNFSPAVIQQFENNLISINDLEMAGVLLGWLALEHPFNMYNVDFNATTHP